MSDVKNKIIKARVSQKEHDEILNYFKENKINFSDYLRRMLLDIVREGKEKEENK